MRILVVDDDPNFLSMTLVVLKNAGHVCRGARDAFEALQILGAEPYDILISDREMPGNDQLALLCNLPEGCRQMPIIVVTGYPTVDSAIHAMKLSVVAYLVKPIAPEELLAQVGRATELCRVRQLLVSSRGEVDAWEGQLKALEHTVQSFPNDAVAAGAQALLAVNLEHLEKTLEQVRQCAVAATEQGTRAIAAPAGLRSDEQLGLLQGLRETIAVLEKTKNSFKSAELGRLRKKLESLFRGPDSR
jgi:DNA-binding response OmpR family regulator